MVTRRAWSPSTRLVVAFAVVLVLVAFAAAYFVAQPPRTGAAPGTVVVAPGTTMSPRVPTPRSSPAPSSTPPTTTTVRTSTVVQPPKRLEAAPVITWISSFTPRGGATTTYAKIANDDCDGALRDARRFAGVLEGAAAACLAAFHGRTDLWATAESRLAAVAPDQFECFEHDLHRLLADIVAAHRKNPAAPLHRQSPGEVTTSCPVILRVEPSHGPAAGKRASLVGLNLGHVETVVQESPLGIDVVGKLKPLGKRGASVKLTAPGPDTSVVGIRVQAWPFEPLATYTYDRAAMGEASTTPTPTS